MRKFLLMACALLPLLLPAQQIEKHINYGGENIGFYEYKPASYNTDKSTKFPVIIFLHGIGERGNGTSELWKVKRISIPAKIAQGETMRFYVKGKWHTFIVLSPQCPTKYGMWPTSYVDAMIDHAERTLRIDRNRIYLTGLSMGGGGTWKYASASQKNAKKLAAIATVCAPATLTNGCNIASAKLPMWSFHATNDPTVAVSIITSAVNKVLNCNPAIKPKKTVWSSGGHAIWDKAFDMKHNYQTPNVFEWFLGYSRNASDDDNTPEPQPGEVPNKPGGSNGSGGSGKNQPPIAKAGADKIIHLPWNTTVLNGTPSIDKDGYIKSFNWKKLSGPASIFGNPNTATTKVYGLVAGMYKFRLTATDGKGASGYDDITVRVNRPPVMRVTAGKTILLPLNNVYLQGTGSYDPDPNGWIKAFRWTKISGPAKYKIANANTGSTKITNLVLGNYTFRVTATDAYGATSYKDVVVRVKIPPYSASHAQLEKEPAVIADSAGATDAVLPSLATLKVYPNPARSVITISLDHERTGKSTATISDVSGRQVKTAVFEKNLQLLSKPLNISELNKGIYTLTVTIENQQVSSQRFVKE